jgi:prophage regulatory protein
MRLLYDEDLKERGIKLSKVQRWRLTKAGRFPKPIKVGERANAYIDTEIDAYIESQIAARDSGKA